MDYSLVFTPVSFAAAKLCEVQAGAGVTELVAAESRYTRRRDAILGAAIPLLNEEGFKGMRLVRVAEQIGLKSTGITYYFPRKEDLAVACVEHGMEIFNAILCEAEKGATPEERIRILVSAFVERDFSVRRGEAPPLVSFAVIRALEGEHRERASQLYRKMFSRTRRLFRPAGSESASHQRDAVRTLILLEQLYWAVDWLAHYDFEEAGRLSARMADVMLHGIAKGGEQDECMPSLIPCSEAPTANEGFMRAATRAINQLGYRGASVDRISASLNLTKGAFYHHHDAKDELVRACFRRTFDIMRRTQHEARSRNAGEWDRLGMVVSTLIHFQFGERGPLLRTSALSSLPKDLQAEVLELSYRAGRTFSSMISDAIAEGSARPVDPTIAAYMLSAGINAAADVLNWPEAPREPPLAQYYRALLFGLLAE